jgi:hypothetical protein
MLRILVDTDAMNRILDTPGLLQEIHAVASRGDFIFISNDEVIAPIAITALGGAADILVTNDSDLMKKTMADYKCYSVWTFEKFIDFVKQCHHGKEPEEGRAMAWGTNPTEEELE